MNKNNNKRKKCCYSDCDALADLMSNYCEKHKPSNLEYLDSYEDYEEDEEEEEDEFLEKWE